MANQGILLVDFELMREVLRLPKSARIVTAGYGTKPPSLDKVVLVLESDDFPPAGKEGPPYVNAEFAADDDGYPVFVQWKICKW